MENTRCTFGERGRMFFCINAEARCFTAYELHAFIRNEMMEHADSITAAAYTSNYHTRQFAFRR